MDGKRVDDDVDDDDDDALVDDTCPCRLRCCWFLLSTDAMCRREDLSFE